jgi:hypothetical protein
MICFGQSGRTLRGETAPYLVYAYWRDDSLGDFKRSNGFENVPLTRKGKLALKLDLHRGLKQTVLRPLKKQLKELRRRWYSLDSP